MECKDFDIENNVENISKAKIKYWREKNASKV